MERELGWSLRDRDRQLLQQVGWFNRLRFLAVGTMLIATVGASELFAVLDDPAPLYVLGAFTLVVNFGYIAWHARLKSERAVRRHVLLQIAIDLLVLTLLLHFSGGVANPVVLFYTFHTFIASLLLSVPIARLVALVSVVLIVALGANGHWGWIEQRPLRIGLFHDSGGAGLAIWIATLALVLGVTVYFVSTILARLRASERELMGLSRQLALSEKLASIGTLAAGVSHEINNPVGVIANKAEIIRYRIQDGDPEEVLLEEVETIDRHVGRIRAITEGLLAFSREAPFELQPLDLGELVREAAELSKVSFAHADVRIVLVPPTGPLPIQGSSNHLLQVLVNVLLNARDASSAGSAVTVSTASDDVEVSVHIEDRGSGIEPQLLDKIFDPFFTTKDVDHGTGLGLALSHGLVERHEGRITVGSEVGIGSRFTITLPRR